MSARRFTEASAGANGIRPFTVETPEAELEAVTSSRTIRRSPERRSPPGMLD
jgi:hypothetical protein